MKSIFAGVAVAMFVSSAAVAQVQGRGDATKDLTNCPPAASGQTTGTASEQAMAVEKSAILPSAEGHTNSAAPTVQRDGQSMEARTDCPQDADQPKPKN